MNISAMIISPANGILETAVTDGSGLRRLPLMVGEAVAVVIKTGDYAGQAILLDTREKKILHKCEGADAELVALFSDCMFAINNAFEDDLSRLLNA